MKGSTMKSTPLRVSAVAGAALTLTLAACAQTSSGGVAASGGDYPAKGIELLVGYDAGGPTDTGARLIAEELEKKLDATVTVTNKPSANSQVAYTELSQAEPDGYTMSAVTFPSAIVTVLDESRGAAYDRDSFAPVALQVVDPTAVAVAPDSELESPEDLVAYAKEHPGELQATTTGVGSNEHFALARLEEAAGADIAPVHFADGSTKAVTAFLGGNVDLLLANVSDLQPLIDAGDVKAIGVMEAERSPFMPDVPTFAEAGYDVEISSSRGFAFPAGTPDAIVDQVSEAIGEIMEDPAFEEKMTQVGLAPSYKDADDYAAYWDQTESLFAELLPLVQEEQS
jgi:tripartite-type tricarboxylate transporter receptor subunit TctC